ncbi:MAG: hypothetical protein HY017_19075 [Betaproteobacteria bacterium]|nr:hypothetical protein [Betaproteobacteria bacterium]
MAGALPKVDDQLLLDMHVHVGPEYLQRRYTAQALMDEGRREGFGAVMKNHFQPTTGWVSQALRPDDQVKFAGAIVLNAAVGGVDDNAIRSAMSGWKRDVHAPDPEHGGAVVWMPTLSSEAHLNLYGRREMPELWGVKGKYSRFVPIGCGFRLDENDEKVMAAVERMLKALAENDLVLATGHLNAVETVALIRRAHAAGIRRILMTHPLFQATNQEVDVLARMWREYGAYSELAFVNIAMDHLTYEQYVQVTEAVGPEGVVLTTDLGQAMNMKVSDGWREYMAELEKRGVKEDDITRMSVLNPHRILYGAELAAKAS